MRVTVESTFYRAGSFGYGKGANEQGETVYFADDWRPIRDMGRALDAGHEVQVDLDESWQIITFEKYMAMQAEALADVGPYMSVAFDQKRLYNNREYRIIVYGAYNVYGNIASEFNGIVVLQEPLPSEEKGEIIADEIACDRGANPESRTKQVELAEKLVAMSDSEFRDFVNQQQNLRFAI